VRILEVVGLPGRAPAPVGAGAAGTRAPAPGCPDVVAAPTSLAARSLAAPAASAARDPESETLLSLAPGAREAEPAAEGAGVLVAGALGATPPIPGMPNPAGDVGFTAAPGVWLAAGADEGPEVGPDGGVAAGADEGADAEVDVAAEESADAEADAVADEGAGAEVDAAADESADGEVDAGAEEGAEAGRCDVFTVGAAAGADVDACDVAPEDVGADAPLLAESVSTGPSGSNN
jgi:hypothetical protein